jgi:ABC-type transport system involved in cytochrome c biogenesis ATPase subunit
MFSPCQKQKEKRMFRTVSVKNFKAINTIEDAPFSRVTLIGGRNEAGKTTLLEALFLYSGRRDPDTVIKLAGWRGFDIIPFEAEYMWSPIFSNFDMTKDISISVTEEDGIKKELLIRYNDQFIPKVPIPIANGGYISPGKSFIQDYKALSFKHDTDYLAHSILHSSGMSYFIEQGGAEDKHLVFYFGPSMVLTDYNPELLSKLDRNDEQDKILGLLRIFEPELKRLQLFKQGKNDVIYADLGNRQKIPVNMLGSGFCRSMTLALMLAAGNNEKIFIDEIENGIHHLYIKKYWDFIFESSKIYNTQIIATTHSYEAISAFAESAQEGGFTDSSYLRLEKNKEKHIAYPFCLKDISATLSYEMEMR